MSVRLPETLDLKAAGPLRDMLMEARGAPVEIDASGVERLGGLCLQVLLSAEATWAADTQPFSISTASEAFIECARRMGASALASDVTIRE